jgi:hypothetical protein
MLKAMVIVAVLMGTGAARGQVIETPVGCIALGGNAVCKLTYPNGNTIQTLADGTTWATVRPGTDEQVSIRMFPSAPTFRTVLIANRDTDILNGPQSDKIQLEGNCGARTFEIMGDEGMSGRNGSGYGMETASWGDLVDAQGGRQIHKVSPGSNVEIALKLLCQQ